MVLREPAGGHDKFGFGLYPHDDLRRVRAKLRVVFCLVERFVPDLPAAHPRPVVCDRGLYVPEPRRIALRAGNEFVHLHAEPFAGAVQRVPVAEAEPRLDPVGEAEVDLFVRPGKIILAFRALGLCPAGEKPHPLDAEVRQEVLVHSEVLIVPIEAFASDGE